MTLSPIYLFAIGTLGVALLTGVQRDLRTESDAPASTDTTVGNPGDQNEEPANSPEDSIRLVGFAAPDMTMTPHRLADEPGASDPPTEPALFAVGEAAQPLVQQPGADIASTSTASHSGLRPRRAKQTRQPLAAIEMRLAPAAQRTRNTTSHGAWPSTSDSTTMAPRVESASPSETASSPIVPPLILGTKATETDVVIPKCPVAPVCPPRCRPRRWWK